MGSTPINIDNENDNNQASNNYNNKSGKKNPGLPINVDLNKLYGVYD